MPDDDRDIEVEERRPPSQRGREGRGLFAQIRAHPALYGVLGVGAVIALVLAFTVFEIQTLFIDEKVDEPLPTANTVPADLIGEDDPTDEPMSAMGDGTTEPEFTVLASGEFRSGQHSTSGTAKTLELADGSRFLRIENLDTDNGPDLFVYLSTAPADAAEGEFDDDFVNLGTLKGNIGNQNYEIPPDVDLSRYGSVAIWCRRFSVLFGAAPLG